MIDHKPECPMLDEQWSKHPLEKCEYCDMISACESRVLNASLILIQEQQRFWANDTLVRIGLGIAKATLYKLREDQHERLTHLRSRSDP